MILKLYLVLLMDTSIWDMKTGLLLVLLEGFRRPISNVVVSYDNRLVINGCGIVFQTRNMETILNENVEDNVVYTKDLRK
jgi:hypothetical protein